MLDMKILYHFSMEDSITDCNTKTTTRIITNEIPIQSPQQLENGRQYKLFIKGQEAGRFEVIEIGKTDMKIRTFLQTGGRVIDRVEYEDYGLGHHQSNGITIIPIKR